MFKKLVDVTNDNVSPFIKYTPKYEYAKKKISFSYSFSKSSISRSPSTNKLDIASSIKDNNNRMQTTEYNTSTPNIKYKKVFDFSKTTPRNNDAFLRTTSNNKDNNSFKIIKFNKSTTRNFLDKTPTSLKQIQMYTDSHYRENKNERVIEPYTKRSEYISTKETNNIINFKNTTKSQMTTTLNSKNYKINEIN
jgi:hypothetical protein